MDRNELVARLAVGTLGPEERRALGGFVTRAELGAAIVVLLRQRGCFPADDDSSGGLQLVLSLAGVRIIMRRHGASKATAVSSVEAAVARYVAEELGPSCNGVPIQPEAPAPASPPDRRPADS